VPRIIIMEARRELLKRQEAHDQYKSEQISKIKEVKARRFMTVDKLIADLRGNEKYEDLIKYIQYLEHINIGTWCDKCEASKTIHTEDADEFAKQLAASVRLARPGDDIIEQLRADVSGLKSITQALNTRVSAIESTIAAMQKNSYKIDLISADGLFE